MGEVVQLRDYQSRAAIERAREVAQDFLKREAIWIANEAFSSVITSPFYHNGAPYDVGPANPENPLLGIVAVPTDYDPRKQWPSNYRAEDKDPA